MPRMLSEPVEITSSVQAGDAFYFGWPFDVVEGSQ